MTKPCAICGHLFSALTARCKYCIKCRDKKKYYTTKKPRTVTCGTCGKKFETVQDSALYCSDPCREQANYKTRILKKVCLVCHTPFMTTTDKRDYCTPVCARDAKLRRDDERHKAARLIRRKDDLTGPGNV